METMKVIIFIILYKKRHMFGVKEKECPSSVLVWLCRYKPSHSVWSINWYHFSKGQWRKLNQALRKHIVLWSYPPKIFRGTHKDYREKDAYHRVRYIYDEFIAAYCSEVEDWLSKSFYIKKRCNFMNLKLLI